MSQPIKARDLEPGHRVELENGSAKTVKTVHKNSRAFKVEYNGDTKYAVYVIYKDGADSILHPNQPVFVR